jgi:hypothetical protein
MASLMTRMKQHDQRSKRINLLKASTVVILFSVMALQLTSHKAPLKTSMLIGLILVAINTVIFMTSLFGKQFGLKKLDLGQPSLIFIRQAIAALPAEMQHITRYLPLFLIFQAIAANIMFIDLWSKLAPVTLVLIHVGTTLLLFLGARLGLMVRRRIYNRSTVPLMEDLRQTEKAWSRGEE